MRQVLIITYYWPPSGGAGVQRWVKFARYLPGYGWKPVVLTVDPDYATYPATDSSLEKDIPENIKIYRTKATDWFRFYGRNKAQVPSAGFAANKDDSIKGKLSRFIRGNFFIPDPRRGWNSFALKKAEELIKKEGIKHIITTSPPHSTQLIGLKLKKRFPGITWLADLRDPWTDIYYYDMFYPTFIARNIDNRYEKKVLLGADMITTIGPSLGTLFEKKAPGIKEKINIIHNGYDESDFENIAPFVPERFTLSYIGTLSEHYPVEGLIKALEDIIKKGFDISLKFTGYISGDQKDKLMSAFGNERIVFNPYTDHKTVIGYMLSASMLLIIQPKTPGNNYFMQGKLFEYIGSGRPVLCLGPTEGDSAKLLENTGHGKCFEYDDVTGITGYISTHLNNENIDIKKSPVELSRKYLTGKLAGLLDNSHDN